MAARSRPKGLGRMEVLGALLDVSMCCPNNESLVLWPDPPADPARWIQPQTQASPEEVAAAGRPNPPADPARWVQPLLLLAVAAAAAAPAALALVVRPESCAIPYVLKGRLRLLHMAGISSQAVSAEPQRCDPHAGGSKEEGFVLMPGRGLRQWVTSHCSACAIRHDR